MRVREAKELSVGRAGKPSKRRKSFPRARNVHAGSDHNLSLWSATGGRLGKDGEMSEKWRFLLKKKKVKCPGDGFGLEF